MPKNDNAHALRLKEAIQLTAGEEEANRFAEKYPLSKSADINKKHQWLAISAKLCKSTFRVRQHLSAELVTVEMAKPWLVRCWLSFKKQEALKKDADCFLKRIHTHSWSMSVTMN